MECCKPIGLWKNQIIYRTLQIAFAKLFKILCIQILYDMIVL